jgi:antitoxin (DNA-binding transcriptional repressor) of toxin-antitoxin stability system
VGQLGTVRFREDPSTGKDAKEQVVINVKLQEAEHRLDQLIDEAAAGEEVVITGSTGSTVRLVPLAKKEEASGKVGHTLDDFFGTWTAEEEAEVLASIEIFERVDESFWK